MKHMTELAHDRALHEARYQTGSRTGALTREYMRRHTWSLVWDSVVVKVRTPIQQELGLQ